jgi:Leucine-rich repeat (LRR) protein
MDNGIFQDLVYFDLSHNDLCDNGVQVLTRMIIKGYFKNITILNLSYNNMTDIGFALIIKTLRFLQLDKCPNIEKIFLEGNRISGKIKNQFGTLPIYYSL